MKQTHTIAVLNQKGGVGKTTTTINLAAYLGKQRRRVLLVDTDPQANATSGVGVDSAKLSATLADGLRGEVGIGEIVVETDIDNVFLAGSAANLASIELDIADKADREHQLEKLLAGVSYDYILIDCPPALGLLTINALSAADLVLIPVQAEYYALEGLSQLLQVIQRVKQNYNSRLELVGVVMTMYDQRTSLASQVHAEVARHFGDKLFKTVIPRNVRLAEAPSHGQPISQYDRWSKGARAYKQLAKEVDSRVYSI